MKATAFAALLLVAIGTFRIIATYQVFNHTIDEPDHLAAGMEWLNTGKYRYEDQHPPLARVFGALGPFLAGERWHSGPDSYLEGYRILGHGPHYDRILALARAGILPFFWIASLVVYLWGYRAGGPAAALGGTLVFATLPPVLAHAGLITTDMALACWTGAAGLTSLYWADYPSRSRSQVFGVVLGLACLSKFSALLFLPAAWMAMYACHLYRTRRGFGEASREIRDRLQTVAVIVGVAFLVVWAGYGFSFARVEFLHLRLPAPRFFSGLHSVWQHNRAGHPSYLLGQRSPNGFWYYFPVVLAIKTPLAMPVLLLAVLCTRLREAALPLAFSAGILACASIGRIDIGVRHILPVYVGFAVGCGTVAGWAWAATGKRGLLAKAAVLVLLAWHAISGSLQHPDYLAYTNEIAVRHPERFVADSDLDWGQDMKRLGASLAEAGATRVTFTPFNRTYGLAGYPMAEMTPGDSERPSPGWNAVSITIWKVFGFPAWADRVAPQKRIGRSILMWYFPE
ncbi:MAG: phospholipid carrier-dependent glycosyltransferase [Acidobacteriia bacterium]|nr:phospholipid carrier-dependent glycosyltransferase [Terriglobia bacterium]